MARANGWRLRRVLGGSLLVLALGGSVLVAVPAAAQDSREAKAELKQTEAEIAKLKKMLGTLQQDMSELETQLKKSESEIGRLRRESQELEKQIRDGETRLQEMHSQAEGLHAALEAQQEQIARQVRSAYMAGQQDYLKLMLNQDDPARVARMMRYYEYVSRIQESAPAEISACQRDGLVRSVYLAGCRMSCAREVLPPCRAVYTGELHRVRNPSPCRSLRSLSRNCSNSSATTTF